MKGKKLNLLIAATLVLSLTTPALAASQQTRITTECTIPDVKIDVTVPSGTKAYLNPNQIPVKVDGTVQDDGVLSDSAYIENRSEIPVKVSAAVTGAIKSGSDLKLSPTSFDPDAETEKKAFLYFEMQAVNQAGLENVTWDSEYNAEKHIVISESTASKDDILTLDANGENKKCYGAFQLSGVCAATPDSSWTTQDGVSMDITFTFKTLPYGTAIE